MTERRRSLPTAGGAILFAYVCAGLAACVSRHTLFETEATNGGQGGGSGHGGSSGQSGLTSGTGGAGTSTGGQATNDPSGGAGASAVALKPWTTCLAAAAQGESGDACVGDFQCSFQEDCCNLVTLCKAGQLYRADDCSTCNVTTPKSCKLDDDCDAGQWCINSACAACGAKQDCAFGWSPIIRHGCAWCAPPNDCTDDTTCAGLICYAGQACLPGCTQDPKCCFGNICAEKGCSTTSTADCSRVGCPLEAQCTGTGQTATSCKCDSSSGMFACAQSGAGNICK